MQTYQGKSVFGGVAIGTICVYQKGEQQVKRTKVEDVEAEVVRFHKAKEQSTEQLGRLYKDSIAKIGEAEAAIFEVHQMMLEDLDYIETIENIIRSQSVNAEYSVASTGNNFYQMFSAMEDEYMRGRAADIKDISERVIKNLMGVNPDGFVIEEPSIIIADDLAPSETVQLDKDKVLAFVTIHGSINSHTAILAKTMNIPALVGTHFLKKNEDLVMYHGKQGIVDGFTGTFYIDPEQEVIRKLQKKREKQLHKQQLLQTLKGKPSVTKDGKEIKLYANIGNTKDLAMVLANDASGIGLFRSEFLYLEADNYPTEEEQFAVYRTVAETMGSKKVIIRTLDIGADKQAEYFNIPHEENPALGFRAIRICLARTDIFKTQLRALYRASAYGNIAIMYPMIISVEEVLEIKRLSKEVRKELKEHGIPYGEVEEGIMIETPAAVMISDELAEEVDFFSIGTNDLTQYTLAIDRQNPELDNIYNPHHKAILRMIQMVVDNAHKAGIWAGICGELGADLSLTETFLKMGVDELSVSPGQVLPVREVIRGSSIQ